MTRHVPVTFALVCCLGSLASSQTATIHQAAKAGPVLVNSNPVSSAAAFKALAETREIGQETLSPGGKYATYVVTVPDVSTNTRREELHVATTDGRRTRRMDAPPQSSPRSVQWLPDGRRFVFLLRTRGTAQIHLGGADAGWSKPITSVAGGVDECAVSPDGGSVAFVAAGSSGKRIWTLSLSGDAGPAPLRQTSSRRHRSVGTRMASRSSFCGRTSQQMPPTPDGPRRPSSVGRIRRGHRGTSGPWTYGRSANGPGPTARSSPC
jgi:hypothetical protein